MGRIVVLGIFVADLAFEAPRLPVMGETLLGQGFRMGPGGKGSNQAVAAGRAGGEVSLLTRVGRDAFGEIARGVWGGANVSTDAVIEDEARPTGAAFIFVSTTDGNNAIIVEPGASGALSPDDVEAARGLIEGASVFVTQLEQPVAAAHRALEIAKAAGVTTVLNPAPAARLPAGMLALCDYVTPNESEAEALTGLAVTSVDEARTAGERLIADGAGAAILTLGARGALLCQGGEATLVPAFPVDEVRDTTGAGDAFNGAFATALGEGRAPVEAVRFACAAASLSVTRAGAAAAMAERREIDAMLAGAP